MIPGETLWLMGSVGIPSWQEVHQSRGEKGFPYISWKSLCIPFDAKLYSNYHLKEGKQVAFEVGFTFVGPRATILNFIDSPSGVPGSLNKVIPEDGKQQPIQACATVSSERSTYSQATRGSKITTPGNKPAQQPSKKSKKQKKLLLCLICSY